MENSRVGFGVLLAFPPEGLGFRVEYIVSIKYIEFIKVKV